MPLYFSPGNQMIIGSCKPLFWTLSQEYVHWTLILNKKTTIKNHGFKINTNNYSKYLRANPLGFSHKDQVDTSI